MKDRKIPYFLPISLGVLIVLIFMLAITVALQFNAKEIEAQKKEAQNNIEVLEADELTRVVNEWRVSQGYSAYIEDERLCDIAKDRVDDGEDNHAGFIEKYYSYPYQLGENMMFRATDERKTLQAWLNSPPHRKALEMSFAYACIAVQGDTAVQIFSNL